MINATKKKTTSELRRYARDLKPLVRIGKNGTTDAQVTEIKRHLKKRGLVKIKLLNSFIQANDRREAAEKIAAMTDSELVSITGFVVVLNRKQKNLNQSR